MARWERRESHGEFLGEATIPVEAAKIVPQLDHRQLTLETVCNAYRAIKTRSLAGKIVLDFPSARSHRRVKPRNTMGNAR